MKLLLSLVQKDFKRNRAITTALAVFLILSALFMAGGLRVTGSMISSLNGLNKLALPPEYLQMHKGTYEEEAFDQFIKSHKYIKDSLVVKMLNINNTNIIYQGETLENCLMDNGFVVQNEGFDYLLNMENEIADVSTGEIGVPVYYAMEYGIQVGDKIVLQEDDYRKELTVSTIIRDAQMNAALTSSKRLLITQADLSDISQHMGEWEYCFEFLLNEDASTAVLQKDYMDAGLPSNGVAVTGSLLTMLNAFSYGIVAFIIIAISFLLIMIAVLCLSYIIEATMADENHTIGEMKAIGFSGRSIVKLYLMKYNILMLIAGVIGYLAAIPLGNLFATSVIQYCGQGNTTWMKWVFPLVGILLLSLLVMIRCRRTIRRNLKHTVIELMRGEEHIKKEGHYSLSLRSMKHRNLTIALGELKCKWKEYTVIFCVFSFSSFLILLPMNMKNTIENPSFITYMGVGECDIRIDMPYNENLGKLKNDVLDYLEQDTQIEKYAIYQNGYVQSMNVDGDMEYIRLQHGDESVFPLEYLEGSMPGQKKEIALSSLEATALGKKVGDLLTVTYRGQEIKLTISGIYQDITYGGKTAKAAIAFEEKDVEAYILYVDVRDGVSIQDKTKELRSILTDSKITPVSEFISQTLGGISESMAMVEVVAFLISLLLIMLITIMFLQLITAREHSAIAIKKAIGFTNEDIRIQFGIRILIIQLLAILVGTFLANYLGEAVFGVMLSSKGISKITMLVEPLTAYLLSPAAQIVVVLFTVIVGTKVVRNYHIRDQIME